MNTIFQTYCFLYIYKKFPQLSAKSKKFDQIKDKTELLQIEKILNPIIEIEKQKLVEKYNKSIGNG